MPQLTFLDQFFGPPTFSVGGGPPYPKRGNVNLVSGATINDNVTTNSTDITISGGGGSSLDTVYTASGGSAAITVSTTTAASFCVFSALTAAGAVSLPSAPGTGQRVTVQIADISGLSFSVIVTANGGKTIGSQATSTYAVIGCASSVIFEYDGTAWRIISISYPRYTPGDSATAFEWQLNEPVGTTSWPNTGTAGTATMTKTAGAAFGTPKPRVGGAVLDGSLDFHSAMIDTGPISIGQTSADLTISIALAMRTIPSFAAHIFGARWGASGTGWSAPFVSFDLGIDDNGYPFFALTQTSGSPTITQLGSTLPWAVFGTAQLCEIEATYVKSTGVMNLYLCGDLAATTTLTPGAGIDYSGTSPSYFIGGAPASVTGQWMDGGLMLARIENVARSQTYLQTRYQQLFGKLPMAA